MSDYSDYSSGGAAGAMPNKQDIMESVRGQFALANAQELLQNMTDKCFTKCITKPGPDLSNSERTCLAKCMDRYMEAWNHIMKVYGTRLSREQDRG